MCVSGCVSRWRFPCAACLTWILSLACLDHSHSLCPGKKDKLRKSVVHSHVKAKAQICNAGKIRPSHTEGAPQTAKQAQHHIYTTGRKKNERHLNKPARPKPLIRQERSPDTPTMTTTPPEDPLVHKARLIEGSSAV
jgi:hypothetical protein